MAAKPGRIRATGTLIDSMTVSSEDKRDVIRRGFEGVRFEPSSKRVRVMLDGSFIADSRRTHLLFDPRRLPVYFFPQSDVTDGTLAPSDRTEETDRGTRRYFHVTAGGRRVENAAWTLTDSPAGHPDLDAYVTFRWSAMDAWYEEDDEVFVHARDPYHRIDVLRSSRAVRVEHAGTVLAGSSRPVILFETGLPPRFYLPKTDVRLDILEPSSTRTACPYKGEADHWSARIDGALYEDLAWSYRLPLAEVGKIENLICFYQERVDVFEVDGERGEIPRTPWSK